jgi:hypothetical protein
LGEEGARRWEGAKLEVAAASSAKVRRSGRFGREPCLRACREEAAEEEEVEREELEEFKEVCFGGWLPLVVGVAARGERRWWDVAAVVEERAMDGTAAVTDGEVAVELLDLHIGRLGTPTIEDRERDQKLVGAFLPSEVRLRAGVIKVSPFLSFALPAELLLRRQRRRGMR